MAAVGFDNQKYIDLQSSAIRKRIADIGGKLYLEFGGKLFDDHHASRILPGFQPDSKLQMLLQLKEDAEIIIAINAADIKSSKLRGDLGITYDADVLRLIDSFRSVGLFVGSVVITQFTPTPAAEAFKRHLETLNVPCYLHYKIDGYPSNVDLIASPEGFGKNDFVPTQRPLVVVTAPGPGSGKMAVCMSQMFHEHKRVQEGSLSVCGGYAKFETFPVWSLPLMHPVNVAYEAATADLADVNLIDPFHLEAYNELAVNYNRDVEVFPVLVAILKKILAPLPCPYKSPTDMGVNCVGSAISNDEVCRQASIQEIIRRHYQAMCAVKQGKGTPEAAQKTSVMLSKLGAPAAELRKVIQPALDVEVATQQPGAALQIPSTGAIVTGRTGELMGCASSVVLNALKALAGIGAGLDLLAPSVLAPVQKLKTQSLGASNPRLHVEEILICLSLSATTNPVAQLALDQLPKLRGAEMHCSVLLGSADAQVLGRMGVRLTCEPKYEIDRLYHK